MENQKPQWLMTEEPILSIATEMHNYFRNLQSYYKIAKGNLISQIESSSDEKQIKKLEQKLREIEEKITLFHVLNNSISTVDTVLHTPSMVTEFKKN